MKIKIFTVLSLLFALLIIGQSSFASNNSFINKYKNASNAAKTQAISNLRKQQAYAHKKAVHLRTLERAENNKLYKNQKKSYDC
jgi:hypothetical protein